MAERGDFLPGIGFIQAIGDARVNDAGDWAFFARTDNGVSSMRDVIIVNGVPALRSGVPIGQHSPPIAVQMENGSGVHLNALGEISGAFQIVDSSDTVAYWNDRVILQEGVTAFSAPGAPVGSVWDHIGQFAVTANGTAFARGWVRMGAQPSQTVSMLVRFQLDDAGNILSTVEVARAGAAVPGSSDTAVIQTPVLPPISGNVINDSGDLLYRVTTGNGERRLMVGADVVLREGDPVPGVSGVIESLGLRFLGTPMGINRAGEWVARVTIGGQRSLLRSDGTVVAMVGEPFAGAPGNATLTALGGPFSQQMITSRGTTMFFADWLDASNQPHRGLFGGEQLLFEFGSTPVDGSTVVPSFSSLDNPAHFSAGGRFFAMTRGLADGRGVVLRVPGLAGIGTPYCATAKNSTGLRAVLTAEGDTTPPYAGLRLLARGLPPQSAGLFLVAPQPNFVPAFTATSEGNLCLGGTIGRFLGPGQVQFSTPDGTLALDLAPTQLPQGSGFASIAPGSTWYFQLWFRDTPSNTSNLSNGLMVDFQ